MSAKTDNLLEKGYWEEVETESKDPLFARVRTGVTNVSKGCVDLVRPSWTKSPGRSKQLHRTAWLDGLRGFAAFLVYWHHHQLWSREAMSQAGDSFENGFGYDGRYFFACLPGVRTFFTGGHFAVTVFFVISGYVLSVKSLGLIHNGEFTKLGDTVASALFRRWPRLHMPLIATTFLYMTSWHAFGIWAVPDPKKNYREELWNWYSEFKQFTFVFRSGGEPWFTYNFHSWSIPVEFRGSIVVYTCLLAFSRCTRNARLGCYCGLIFYFMYIADGWFCALFISGMLLCELDLLAARDELPRFLKRLERFKKFIYYVLFISSIYLGGVPSHSFDLTSLRNSPGWYFLSYLKPQAVFDYKWFYLFWAATFMVACIPRILWLKAFFETKFCQYLGRISFSLYLVHGPVIWTLGDRLYAATGWPREAHALGLHGWVNRFPLPKTGPKGLEFSYLAPHLILLPLTLWLAELVTKLFDEPSNRFCQWLYRKTLAPSTKA
ncbi:MAG: hypothetical protein Q9160_002981 [Pyrenula sp. 1 TL-2023]